MHLCDAVAASSQKPFYCLIIGTNHAFTRSVRTVAMVFLMPTTYKMYVVFLGAYIDSVVAYVLFAFQHVYADHRDVFCAACNEPIVSSPNLKKKTKGYRTTRDHHQENHHWIMCKCILCKNYDEYAIVLNEVCVIEPEIRDIQ